MLPMLMLLGPALAAPTPQVPGGELDGYRLVFSDEFEGDRLDDAAWTCRTGPRLWSENRAANVSVADGRLKLACRREPAGELNYTSGGIISRELFGHGYFEARFRVPPGAGWHTSFWLMRFDQAAAKRAGQPVQEVDICEQDSVNPHRWAPNLHRWLPEPHVAMGHRNIDVAPDLSAGYHTWGCLWLPQRLTFYFDGQPVHSIDATAYPHGPQNLWLTTVAANLGGTKAVDDRLLPAAAEFDYVRVWVPDQPAPSAALDLGARLAPSPETARFVDPDWYIWCGAPIRGDDGRYHLFYSRWPRRLGHQAWVTHSEIAHATAPTALGPWTHHDVALPARGKEFWDGLCTHNPTILRVGGRYYLYYMGNTGDGQAMATLNWTHRSNQRVGVAWSDRLDGPWQRQDKPLVDVTPGFHDAICTTNPSVTQRPDGGFLMIYKAVADRRPAPSYGPVVHIAALSDSPLGPFVKQPNPVFTAGDAAFPAEDPYIWFGPDRYWAVLKDMGGHFTGAGKSLVLFESRDGLDWKLAEHPLVSKVQLTRPDGTIVPLNSLERPQILFENGLPTTLYCAVDEIPSRPHSYNVQIPIRP